ncbi:MAG: LysR family transcriptional regulator [Pseudomonadota bacterium]|nr:LysR family transcriptional regulator [Pseudomonadota bacterium]
MRLGTLDLNLIVALDAILRLRSVTAAADELNLTQPAVSRALGRLREHFEDPIVAPFGREMRPTEFGKRLQENTAFLLNQSRQFSEMRPGFDPETSHRVFSVMASDFVVQVLLVSLLPELSRVAPGVRFDVVPIDGQNEARFSRGEIDFAIVPEPFLYDAEPSEYLMTEDYVCAFWEENPNVGDTLDLETYTRLRHVLATLRDQPVGSQFELTLKEQGVEIDVAMSLPSQSLIGACLVGTPWIATVHRRVWNSLPKSMPLRSLPVPLDIKPLVLCLQWSRLRIADDATEWMKRVLLDHAAELV